MLRDLHETGLWAIFPHTLHVDLFSSWNFQVCNLCFVCRWIELTNYSVNHIGMETNRNLLATASTMGCLAKRKNDCNSFHWYFWMKSGSEKKSEVTQIRFIRSEMHTMGYGILRSSIQTQMICIHKRLCHFRLDFTRTIKMKRWSEVDTRTKRKKKKSENLLFDEAHLAFVVCSQ